MSIIRIPVFLCWLLPLGIQAQVSISESGVDPDASSVLDVQSTDKGILVPRMTDAQRDAIVDPATGLLVFVNTDSSFYYFEGTAWRRISASPNQEDIADAAGFPDSVLYTTSLPDILTDLEVEGEYAYILKSSGGTSSLLVYHVSDPANISQVASYDPFLMGSLHAMDARSSIAAITDATRVELLDISDPSNPVFINDYSNGFTPKLYLKFYSEDILFTHSSFFNGGELEIREISTNTIKNVPIGSRPVDIAFSGNYAFVTNTGNDQLEVIDFSDIPNASVVHMVSLGSDPGSVSVSGNYAYVTNNGNDMLEIIDISDPLTASVVHTVNLGSDPKQVRTNANYAFVLDKTNSLFQIIDITSPTSAHLLESLNLGGSPSSFDIEGGYAYVVNGSSGAFKLQVFTIPFGNGLLLPLYDLGGNISGFSNPADLMQKIDLFDLSGNNLQLSLIGDGEAPRTVNLSGYLDNTDAQVLSLNSNTLSLTNGGSVDLSGYLDNTDAQVLSLNSNTLSLTNGGSVNLSGYLDNTDSQALSLNSNTLSLTNGGSVNLSGYLDADNLGNHSATTNIQLNGNFLSNDGDNEGIKVDNTGRVGIGTGTPAEKLEVQGTIRMVDGNQQAGHIPVSDTNGSMTWADPDGLIAGWTIDSLFASVPTNGTSLQDASSEDGQSTVTVAPGLTAWQSFTAERKGMLVEVDAHHYTAPITSGTLKIYEGEGVSGPLLHEQSISSTVTNEWSNYPLTTGVVLTAGNQYTVAFISDVSCKYLFNSMDPYPGGRAGSFSNPSWDLRFRTYLIPATQLFAVDPVSGSVSLANSRMTIKGNGDVGIGTTSPASRLHVVNNLGTANQYAATMENNTNAAWSNGLLIKAGENSQSANNRFLSFRRPDGTEIGAVRQINSSYVDFWAPSDRRLKSGFRPAAAGLKELMGIEVSDYVYNDDPDKPQTGFVAQQLFNYYPYAVVPGGENPKTDPWTVNYGRVTPLLVKAVQEQQKMIESLQSENAMLKSKLEKVDDLEAKLAKIEEVMTSSATIDQKTSE